MALDKIVDSAVLDANLTAVADAIREKGGTEDALAFPNGFVSAIAAIESGGGGVGVAPMIDHGGGYLTFSPANDTVIPAGGRVFNVETSSYDDTNMTEVNCAAGYIYGHPEITTYWDYSNKWGWHFPYMWNSSATDFTLKAGETYTLVFLFHA